MLSRAHILVSGFVQGVCFRDFTSSHATAMKLTGWIRNLSDGRVEAIVEGPRNDIEAFLGLIERGPRAARVENVELAWQDYAGSFKDFRILWQ